MKFFLHWKKARGDHMLTAAIVTSLGLTGIFAEILFNKNPGLLHVIWFFLSSLGGVIIPAYLIPKSWIDYEGKIPVHSFWKELLS